jgi:zinc protease
MSRDELYDHYQRHYVPGNAVVSLTGDFDRNDVLARIEELFGPIPAGAPIDLIPRPEPVQRGERRVSVDGPGETAYLTYAYRVPEGTHPDFQPLVLLNAAYAGGSSLGFFGGGTTNKSSRLYKTLVGTDLAAAVYGSVSPSIDPYLYTISAVARPNRSLDDIEAALDHELDRLAQEPVSRQELEKALKRARVQFVMAGESVTGQAQMLGLAEMVAGDHRWYEKTLDSLNNVTLEDIDRVRNKYLRKKNRVVGRYNPTGNEAYV